MKLLSRSLRDYIQSEVTAFYLDKGGRYVVVPDYFLLELEEQYEELRHDLADVECERDDYLASIRGLQEQIQLLEREAEIQNDEAERLHEQLGGK